MTTTISKHDLQQMQHLHAIASITVNNSSTTNANFHNSINDNTATTTTTTTTTKTSTPKSATTRNRLDSTTTIIQIDTLNNNTAAANTPLNGGGSESLALNNNGTIPIDNEDEPQKTQKRRSLLNFKSLDFHIKYLYSGLRGNGQRNSRTPTQLSAVANGGDCANVEHATSCADNKAILEAQLTHKRMPPYLKIEAVDSEESENLLLDYPQSPYSTRRNSSHEDNRSSSQLLHINRYELNRSQGSSPYYLSPYALDSTQNMRRSSASDIMSCKRSGTSSNSGSRRPSTTDLLRKARERRGSEARMGRSVSHSGLTRGGFRGGCGAGGRRTSMAF